MRESQAPKDSHSESYDNKPESSERSSPTMEVLSLAR